MVWKWPLPKSGSSFSKLTGGALAKLPFFELQIGPPFNKLIQDPRKFWRYRSRNIFLWGVVILIVMHILMLIGGGSFNLATLLFYGYFAFLTSIVFNILYCVFNPEKYRRFR